MMSLGLISTLLRLLAITYCVALMHRTKDRLMIVLTLVVASLGLSQVVHTYHMAMPGRVHSQLLEETIRLLGGFSIIAGAYYVGRIILATVASRRQQEESAFVLSKAQEIARIGSWSYDVAGGKYEWSRELLGLFGINPADFDGHLGSLLLCVHTEDRERVIEAMRLVARRNNLFPFEYRICLQGGAIKHVWAECLVLRNAQGQVFRVIGTVQDITMRVRAEEGLRESRGRLKLLNTLANSAMNSPATSTMIDLAVQESSRVVAPHRAFFGLIDHRNRLRIIPAGIPGPTLQYWNTPIDLSGNKEVLDTLRERRMVVAHEVAAHPGFAAFADRCSRSGIRAVVCVPIHYLPDALGVFGLTAVEPHHWTEHELATVREVSEYLSCALNNLHVEEERRRSEAEVRSSEERFQTVLRTVNDVIWAMDSGQTRFLYLNDAVSTVFGRPAQDFYKRPELWRESVFHEDRSRYDQSTQELINTGVSELEHRIVRPGGETRWVITKRVLGRDPDGRPVRIAGVTADITERRRLSAQLQHAQKLESLGAMAEGFAHDFNNLIMAILANASVTLAELPPGTPQQDALARLENDAQRAAHLCAQLLAYSGKGRFEIENVDLNAFIHESMPTFNALLPPNVIIRLDLDARVRPVEVDRTQLRQAISNLILNASEALGARGGSVTLATAPGAADELAARNLVLGNLPQDAPLACIRIEDNGCGITPENISRVFDPFFSTKNPGRGLGLPAALGIMRAHRGAILVESGPDSGSRFTLALPAQP